MNTTNYPGQKILIRESSFSSLRGKTTVQNHRWNIIAINTEDWRRER